MNRSSYTRLPERFFARIRPDAVAAPRLLKFNHDWAPSWGLTARPGHWQGCIPAMSYRPIWSRSRWPTPAISLATSYRS